MKTEKFEVLTDVEHCRRRPNMYIGSTTLETVEGFVNGKFQKYQVVPGLVKIIDEVLDNAIDEFIRSAGKAADKIAVEINKESDSITISDNGRGIPVEKHDGGRYRPFLCWGAARAGTSFGGDRATIGAHGLGSFLTNVFSTEFTGESCDGKRTYKGVWKNGKLVKEKVSGAGRSGTTVTFTPDYGFFGYTGAPDILGELIKDRLYHLSATFPDLRFKYNGEIIKYRNRKTFGELYLKEEDCVAYEDENSILLFGPSGTDEEFRCSSHVNGLNLRQGGTQVDFVVQELINELRPLLKKKYKLEVLPNAIKQHLLLVQIVRKMENLKFDSQTKNKITNSYAEVKAQLPNINFEVIARKIIYNDNIVKPMVEALLFKKQLEEQRELNKEQKNGRKIKIANHITATSTKREEKILFIAEGDSAIGRLRKVRDSKIHGGYALRGKVMNTREMRPLEIVKNTELSELMSILNIKLGEKAVNVEYGKIGILTDADVDGQSIMCLLINFFSNWPELFSQGRIYRVETPIVIARRGKEEKRFYSFDEFNKEELDKKWQVEYFKGLGSLSEDEYRKAINSPRLLKIGATKASEFEKLDMAFGPDADVRKEWLMK